MQLFYEIADLYVAGLHNLRIDASEIQFSSQFRVYEFHCVPAEPFSEFPAAGVRYRGDLNNRCAKGELCIGR